MVTEEREILPQALEPSPADVLRGLAAPAARIVGDAASILEEELAMGIEAAKRVEARMINVAQVRQGEDSIEVLRRFRRDAHEIVDILLDLLSVATNAAQTMTKRLITIQTGVSSVDLNGAQSIPILRVPNAIQNAVAEISMSIENSGATPTGALAPIATDLLGARGGRLTAGNVSFAPPEVVIAAQGRENLAVSVRVPPGTEPGLYSGLIQVAGMEGLRAVLVVEVAPPLRRSAAMPSSARTTRPARSRRA